MMTHVHPRPRDHPAAAGIGGSRRAPRAGGALPFGAVMATGAVSQLSPLAGLPALRLPLLALTVAIAGSVTGSGMARRMRRGRGNSSLAQRLGQFTVPVGLAVIAAGLTNLEGAGFVAAAVAVGAAAGVTTLAITATAAASAWRERPRLAAVSGLWFIAPAAYLADAAAAVAIGARAGGADALAYTAVIAVAIGTIGYAALLVLAALRVRAHGLAEAPRTAWWIVVGCGGLAGFALGRVAAGAAPIMGPIAPVLDAAGLGCVIAATLVLVPVAVGSVRFAARLVSRRPWRAGRAAWPPAFSSGVYALGCSAVARSLDSPAVTVIARIVAVETLVVWAVIAGIHVAAWASALRARRG